MGLHGSRAASEAAGDLLAGEAAPTALVSAQDVITIGTVDRLRTLDLRSTVALVDLVLADAVDPALTVVAQDGDRLGRAAAELLFARLDGDRGAARRVVVPTTLVVRGSGELRR
jgi:LacI family transcriptional regulator